MDQIKFWKSAYEEMRQLGLECGNVNIDLRENLESANKVIVALSEALGEVATVNPPYVMGKIAHTLTLHASAIEKARGEG